MAIRGIDVSALQGAISWTQVAASGVRFAYLRCGVGNDAPDMRFAVNLNGAQQAGLVVGAYHFVYPLPDAPGHPGRDPISQARAHYHASGGLGSHDGELPPAIDLEWPEPKDWDRWFCTAVQIRTWALAYLAECTRLHGRKPIVYTYPYYGSALRLQECPEFASYDLWAASYELVAATIPPWGAHAVWQTTGGGGRLPNGMPVDTDEIDDEETLLRLTTVVSPDEAA
jgi:lysozyme